MLDFDCKSCDEQLKRERGCGEKGIIPFMIDREMVFRCPLKLIDNITWEYVKAYRFYKKGSYFIYI